MRDIGTADAMSQSIHVSHCQFIVQNSSVRHTATAEAISQSTHISLFQLVKVFHKSDTRLLLRQSINQDLEVNLLGLCDLAHILMTKVSSRLSIQKMFASTTLLI